MLLRAGSEICSVQADDDTPLHVALQRGNITMAQILLDAGADVLVQHPLYDHSAMHDKATSGLVTTTQLLLKAGSDMTASNCMGRTARQNAILGGSVGIAGVLPEAGTNMSAQTRTGETALDLAMSDRAYARFTPERAAAY